MNPLNGYQTYIIGGLSIAVGVISYIINITVPDVHWPIDNGAASVMITTGLGLLGLRNAVGNIK